MGIIQGQLRYIGTIDQGPLLAPIKGTTRTATPKTRPSPSWGFRVEGLGIRVWVLGVPGPKARAALAPEAEILSSEPKTARAPYICTVLGKDLQGIGFRVLGFRGPYLFSRLVSFLRRFSRFWAGTVRVSAFRVSGLGFRVSIYCRVSGF